VLVTSGVEEIELTKPVEFLRSHGAQVTIITPKRQELEEGIHALNGIHCGGTHRADAVLSDVRPQEFDALFIPGGISPDHLRLESGTTDFVKQFADKPLVALCHGPQLLVSADMVRGRTITSWPSLEIDMKNAGAKWVNEEVVVDGNLITSRMPKDIDALDRKMEEALTHPEQYRRKAA